MIGNMKVGGFNFFNLAVLIAMVAALGACAYDAEEVTVRRHRIRYEPIYDESRCFIPKTQGEDVIVPAAEEIVTSPFFGKRYDRSILKGVLTASAVATGRYANDLLRGRVFRVPRDTVPGAVVCPMFTELPVAPDDLRELWDRFAGGARGGWRLAGLFFEDCGRDGFSCSDRELVRPTILIDEARDRWTLVHELMHFNFSRERKRDPRMPPLSSLAKEAERRKQAVRELFAAYKKTGPDRNVLAALQAHSSWLLREWFYHTMVHTVLEEVAVEGLLVDEFLSDRLQNVSPASLDIALMYMERSLERMLAEYDSRSIKGVEGAEDLSLRALRTFIYEEASKRNWKEIRSSVQGDIAFFSRWVSSTRNLIDSRRGRIYEYFRSNPFIRFSVETKRRAAVGHFEHSPEWRVFELWKD